MKNIALFLSMCILAAMMAGCGSSQQAQPGGSKADYADILRSIRTEEENQFYPIVTSKDDEGFELAFGAFGGSEEHMQRCAISISAIMITTYGVGIILPAEGKMEEIVKQVEDFFKSQQKAFEDYLPLQYEIAKNAKYEVASSGEVIFAMCENPQEVIKGIKAGLEE